MINGVVRSDRQVVIPLTIRGSAERDQDIEAIIDTGFDGWLSLPPSLIAALALEWRQRGRAFLADGSECVFDIYEGTVIWDGQNVRIPVHEAETAPLVGMSLLDGYELVIQVRSSGSVIVRKLTS
jgi:clan AA aspartic protease